MGKHIFEHKEYAEGPFQFYEQEYQKFDQVVTYQKICKQNKGRLTPINDIHLLKGS